MNRTLLIGAMTIGVVTAAIAIAVSGIAGASSESESARCAVPAAERQSPDALKQKLEGEGWKVRRIKSEDGCFEVYGFDAQGRKIEAYFHPKSLAMLKRGEED